MPEKYPLDVGGLSAEEAYNMLIAYGVSPSDAAITISSWIYENHGKTERTFNYVEPFAQVEPGCVTSFKRTFAHINWTDGESVVQAEQTAGDEGFNARFHKIEDDLDALGADVVKAFDCMAEMRKSLRTLLDEIRAEINRLHSDIVDCCSRGTSTGQIFQGYGGIVDTGRFLGTTTFGHKKVSIWQTGQGIFMLPTVETIGVDVLTDQRVRYPAALARYIVENPKVRAYFDNIEQRPITKQKMVRQFGTDRTREGLSVHELVDILPDETAFETPEAMVEAVVERQAAALRTTAGAPAAIASVFGLETEVETVGRASVDRVQVIPAKARSVLIFKGLDTMEKLASATPEDVVSFLHDEGIETTTAEAIEWTTTAKTLSRTTPEVY